MAGYQGYPSSNPYTYTPTTTTAGAASSTPNPATTGPIYPAYTYGQPQHIASPYATTSAPSTQYPATSTYPDTSTHPATSTYPAYSYGQMQHQTSPYATTSAHSTQHPAPAGYPAYSYGQMQHQANPYGTVAAIQNPSVAHSTPVQRTFANTSQPAGVAASPYDQVSYPPSFTTYTATTQSPHASTTATEQTITGARSGVAALAARFGRSAPRPRAADEHSREVWILSFPSTLFKSHWAVWIPRKDSVQTHQSDQQGTLIHVEGDLRNGFGHEFQRRNFGPKSVRHPRGYVLGRIHDQYISDGPDRGIDKVAYNTVEQVALSIPAPRSSLNPASSEAAGTRPELRDCQWWLKRFIDELINRGMLSAEARRVVAETPVQWA